LVVDDGDAVAAGLEGDEEGAAGWRVAEEATARARPFRERALSASKRSTSLATHSPSGPT